LRVAFDSVGNLYVLDEGSAQVRKFSPTGQLLTVLGPRGSVADQFNPLDDIVVDQGGSIYVMRGSRGRLQKLSADGSVEPGWALGGSWTNQSIRPRSVVLDSGGTLYLADPERNQVQKWLADGRLVSSWPPPGSGLLALQGPTDLAVDGDGFITVVDLHGTRLQQFSPDGDLVGSWTFVRDESDSGPFPAVGGLAVDEDGRVYAALAGTGSGIHVFDRGLRPVGRWPNRIQSAAAIHYPRDLAFARGSLYLVDGRGVSVLRVPAAGD
jgi:sugar lactone lactonase YvrE